LRFAGENEKSDESTKYDISIGCAYHLHNACRYQESYTQNQKLAYHASQIGDLDLAERCYKRAIVDAEHLENTDSKLNCIIGLNKNAYEVWSRYDEALKNYYDILDQKEDVDWKAAVQLNIADIHIRQRKYDEALEILYKVLPASHDQLFKSTVFQRMAVISEVKEKYDEALGILETKVLPIAKDLGNRLTM
jgi:tetratricopeptide (TPR) repeat protein